MNYQQHPIGACYPPLSAEEFRKLRASLHDPGSKPPAILFEGKILDGWHYYKACLEEGIQPAFETPKITDPITFVVRRNEGRRQLDKDARAEIALKLANVKKGGAGGYTLSDSPNGRSPAIKQAEAEKLMGVAKGAASRAQQIRDRAIPEVQEAYKAKKITAFRAAEIATLSKDGQVRELAKWIEKKVQPRSRSNGTRQSKPKQTKETRSQRMERLQQMLRKNKKPGELVGLTREQVDPDFKGSSMEWVDKYGHVQIMTKAELEADQKAAALMAWVEALNDLRKPLEKYLKTEPVVLEDLEAWVKKSQERRWRRLEEMVGLLGRARDSVGPVLGLLDKLTQP